MVDQAEITKWCMPATKDAIFKSKNLYFILGDDEPAEKNMQKKVDKFEADALAEEFHDLELTENKDQVAYDEV